MRNRLYRQMLTGFGISLLMVGSTTLSLNYYLVKSDLKQQVKTQAKSIAQTLEFSTEGLLEGGDESTLQRVVQNYAMLPAVVEITIVSPSRQVLAQGPSLSQPKAHTLDNLALLQNLEEASLSGISRDFETVLADRSLLTYCLPFSSPIFNAGGHRGVVLVTLDLQQMQQESWNIFVTTTTTLTIGTLILTVVIGLLLRKCLLAPLIALNDAIAASQSTKHFSAPAHLPPNEIRFLSDTFEQVIQQQYRIEADLRQSEEKERHNAQQLTKMLQALRSTQAQLIQTEKMAGLGQMVAGIAHEINNPVSFIYGNIEHATGYFRDIAELLNCYQTQYPIATESIQAMQERIDLEFVLTDLPKLLASTRLGTERIRDIVLSLRTFSRLDESERKPVDIAASIESALLLVNSRLCGGENIKEGGRKRDKSRHPEIEVVRNYEELPRVDCYASYLNQVFLNILTNAIDALETLDSPGTTEEKMSSQTADNQPANDQRPRRIEITTTQQNERCIISISDNGPGIPKDVRPKIFDPFFTTKPVGEGTGLGLSVSYQVIESHGGKITCTSSCAGKESLGYGRESGTTFIIELPICQAYMSSNIKTANPANSALAR